MADFYPQTMDAKAQWHQNFSTRLPDFETKYNLAAGDITGAAADSAWMTYWVGARHTADAQSQAMTSFFNTIAGKLTDPPPPAVLMWELTLPIATQVSPGIEKRVRDIARHIKGHLAYSAADGEALGIVGADDATGNATQPVIELKTRVAFEVGVKFRKLGNDGIRIEYRHQGGDWIPGGVLLTSPGAFTVAPATPDTPEQIEVRAVYLNGNTPTGDYSDTGSVYVGP